MERDGRHAWSWLREMISSPNKNSAACMTDGKNHNCLCGEALELLKATPVWQSEVHPCVNRKWERRWCLIVLSPDASSESSLRRNEWARLKWGRFCHSWSPLTFWMKGCEGHKRLTLLSLLLSCPAFLCMPVHAIRILCRCLFISTLHFSLFSSL